MADKPTSPWLQLQAWREQGADRIDPLRFSLIDGLARRAAAHDGQVTQLLHARLAQLVADYARVVAASPPATAAAAVSPPTPLRALLAHIGGAAQPALSAWPPPAAAPAGATPATAAATTAREPLAVLDEFQQLWGRIRIDSLLRQSQEAISEDAGPLHSSVLLHRAMTLMRDISPEYLQHFLAYSDALSWLEQLHTAGGAQGAEPARTGTARKAARRSAPRRRKASAAAEQIPDAAPE
ncbi:hypothetical protein ARC78_05190 [Stenotrophomonas pictorum JCM 9942]|uniref:DUF2894 domain-containing protein n=1 Tax=Stenotrophomonas pictorum JCM 9942 TaxID=1236960 RepID=A0A0R0AHE4_9GAMM|nr:DUF2894 domain-containing protein [Stenotrophomonas pictorum]KRG44544.1 hypothetical protein ARC78_05190 [Stenotrophomonas pictorum JCM 9942]